MEIKGLIGETAGQVWHLLETDGPQTLPQLKRKLEGTAPFLDFAVGGSFGKRGLTLTWKKRLTSSD